MKVMEQPIKSSLN